MDKIWILGICRCVLILKSYWSPNNHSSLDWTRCGRLRLSWKLAAWAIELLDHHGLKSQVCFVCCGVLGMVRMIHKGSLEWLLPCNRDYKKDFSKQGDCQEVWWHWSTSDQRRYEQQLWWLGSQTLPSERGGHDASSERSFCMELLTVCL